MKTFVDICCPGNGKRYELMYTKAPPLGSDDVFAWLNSPWGGRAMKIPSGLPHIHWTHMTILHMAHVRVRHTGESPCHEAPHSLTSANSGGAG